jgi:hypothetical protein
MTTAASRTKVHCGRGGRLTAVCSDCAVELGLALGAEVAGALSSLDAAHPAGEYPAHAHPAPRGWVAVSPAVGAGSRRLSGDVQVATWRATTGP